MALTKAIQEWSLDFVDDALDSGRRIRMLTVVDDFTNPPFPYPRLGVSELS